MDAAPHVRDLQQRFDLRELRTACLEDRPEQRLLFERVLSATGSVVVTAKTGSGKTVAWILMAVQELARGGRVVFATVTRHLVPQFVQYVLKFTTLAPEDVVGITGQLTSRQRQRLYLRKPRVLIGTREAFLQDIKHGLFVWEGIRLFGSDEIHHMQGNDTYTVLVPYLKAQPGLRLFYGSATLAYTREKLHGLLYDLAADHVFIVPSTREILREKDYVVDLDDQLAWATGLIRGEAEKVWRFLQGQLPYQQGWLFDMDEQSWDPEPAAFPGYTERERLLRHLRSLDVDELKKRFLHSKWCELGLLCWLHESLVTCGRFVFLETFGYCYAKYRLVPQSFIVRDLESGRRPVIRFFEQRVVSNDRLWLVFSTLARGTPYEALVEHQFWHHVLGETMETATDFFDAALHSMAKRRTVDHPKMEPCLAIFHEHPQRLQSGHVIVFAGTRRHAQFLAAWLNDRLYAVGYCAAAVMGPRNARQRRRSARGLADFKEDRANILVSTDYVREGMDVPRAQVCIEFSTLDSNPIKKKQGKGRVGRDLRHTAAYLYYLLTRQSAEEWRLQAARRRTSAMRRATGRRGEWLFLEDP